MHEQTRSANHVDSSRNRLWTITILTIDEGVQPAQEELTRTLVTWRQQVNQKLRLTKRDNEARVRHSCGDERFRRQQLLNAHVHFRN